MKFTKMHGCGNDYVYVNLFEEKLDDPARVSIYVSDRHFGIGSDGLITIGPSDKADFRMRIYNADGSEAEMCGNGIRCVAKYVYDHKLTDKTEISVETGAGIKYLTLYVEENKVSQVRVDMGEPILKPGDIPVVKADGSAYGDDYRVIDEPISAGNREWHMTCVSMGNPHAVVFVDDVANFELEKYGPLFENHKMFPKRTNTEFVEILSRNEAKRPVPRYDFKAFGAAIKAAREGCKESRKKVGDEMFISPRYLANIENKGQHPSLQIFFELMLRYNISVDQFLLETPPEKNTQRRQLDALLDGMSDTGIRIVTATAKEISEVEKEGE